MTDIFAEPGPGPRPCRRAQAAEGREACPRTGRGHGRRESTMTTATTPIENAYEAFGACPDCDKHDGYINIGRSHWFYCAEHKTCWIAGSNLFSTWLDQTEDEQRRRYEELDFGSFAYIAWNAADARRHEQFFNEPAGSCRVRPNVVPF